MKYWIWFSTLKEISIVKKMGLLNKFGDVKNIYYAKEKELLEVEGITLKTIHEINNNKNEEILQKYEAYIRKNDIKLINLTDKNYPENLKNIYDPPITLFAKGNLGLLNKRSIAVVGCREPSEYGTNVAKTFSFELSKNNIVIVSGMARGIDTVAHIGALNASGETIAVLGCGLDIIYPKENSFVYKQILEKGLILSEYIVGTRPEAMNFPARNRIISALSSGVLVVEAKEKSGTMITTDFALEQGKELYVIPGNITSPNSVGTNSLIKEGAKLVTNYKEILEDLGILF